MDKKKGLPTAQHKPQPGDIVLFPSSLFHGTIPFSSEDEAIKISNETSYGLTNYIQTKDKEKAKRVAKQLRSGMVEINGENFADGSPFGGYKQSGNGREGGTWGLEEYLEVKSISGWK